MINMIWLAVVIWIGGVLAMWRARPRGAWYALVLAVLLWPLIVLYAVWHRNEPRRWGDYRDDEVCYYR